MDYSTPRNSRTPLCHLGEPGALLVMRHCQPMVSRDVLVPRWRCDAIPGTLPIRTLGLVEFDHRRPGYFLGGLWMLVA